MPVVSDYGQLLSPLIKTSRLVAVEILRFRSDVVGIAVIRAYKAAL